MALTDGPPPASAGWLAAADSLEKNVDTPPELRTRGMLPLPGALEGAEPGLDGGRGGPDRRAGAADADGGSMRSPNTLRTPFMRRADVEEPVAGMHALNGFTATVAAAVKFVVSVRIPPQVSTFVCIAWCSSLTNHQRKRILPKIGL